MSFNTGSVRHKFGVRNRVSRSAQFIRDVATELASSRNKRKLRCALIEYNYYHAETFPTLVWILNMLGIKVDVFSSHRVIRNNPFIYTQGLDYTLRETEGLFFRMWVADRGFRNYNVIVLNSLEPKVLLSKVSNIQIPMIGVIHNVSLLATDLEYRQFFSSKKRKPLVLAKHISRFLPVSDPLPWISPVLLGHVTSPKHEDNVTRFCVQGNVEFNRRNYESLLNAVQELDSDSQNRVHVLVAGRSYYPDGVTLKEQIRKRNLEQVFEFTEGELNYRDLYGSIATSSFLLPLVDTTLEDNVHYLRDKLSTSMQVAIAFGIPLIVHRELASLYQVEDFSITYQDGGLGRALRVALGTTDIQIERMRDCLRARREALLGESAERFSQALLDLGISLEKKHRPKPWQRKLEGSRDEIPNP